MFLDTNDGELTNGGGTATNFNNTTVRLDSGSSGLLGINHSGDNYIAYCWSEIPGYSKFGIYRGNDSSDGVFNHCGFKPACVITAGKNSSDAWFIFDNKRDPDNIGHHRLFPNQNSSESTSVNSSSTQFDFYSNGFKFRGSSDDANGTNRHYIYMAFAEASVNTPFGSSSLAR